LIELTRMRRDPLVGDVFYHFKMIVIVQITHMDEHEDTHKDTGRKHR